MGKNLVYFIVLVLFSNFALAATIHGSIYSFDLEKGENIIISVDSKPSQTIVSKDGEYSFELDLGEYIINATSYSEIWEVKEFVSEDIKIEKQGSYILDLILFPSFEEEEELLQETDEEVIDEEKDYMTIAIFIVSLILVGVVFYFVFKYKKILQDVEKEVKKTAEKTEKLDIDDKLTKDVLDFIKAKGGRVMQKEIRKKFPYSEAKISLVVSELEEKKIVRRIKKGRGNLVVLDNHLN